MYEIALPLENVLLCTKRFIMNAYVKAISIDKIGEETREALQCINELDDCLQKLAPYVNYQKKLMKDSQDFKNRKTQ